MKRKNTLAFILSACVLAGALGGCGDKPAESSSLPSSTPSSSQTVESSEPESNVPDYMNATGYPITKDKITVTVLGQKDPGAAEWNDLLLFQKAEELTNIHFDFTLVESTSYAEKKNLALASGEYPDVFMRQLGVSDEETYGPLGTLLDLTDLISQYAPNLSARMAEEPEIQGSMIATDGKIYGLPYICRTATRNPSVSFYDLNWLDNVGLEPPQTIDELYTVLKAFKEQDANGNGDPNDEIPWSNAGGDGALNAFRTAILPAFFGAFVDGNHLAVKDDGTVFFPPAEDTYKEYLAYLHKLYSEGLIDPESFTQTSQQHQAKCKSNIVGILNASPTIMPAEFNGNYWSLAALTSEFNDVKVMPPYTNIYTSRGAITDKCQYPEAVMRWFDIWYAKDEEAVEGLCGNALFLGIQGEHWDYADAEKTQYSFIEPVTAFQDVNATISVNMYIPSYLNFMAYPTNFPLMEMKVKAVQTEQEPYQKDGYSPYARATKEENDQLALVETDIQNYVKQMTSKFIVGEASLDEFESYVTTLENMGLADYLALKQSIQDRYMAGIQ